MIIVTLSEAAKSIGVTVQSLRKRADIKELLQRVEDGEIEWHSVQRRGGGKGIELAEFPADIRVAICALRGQANAPAAEVEESHQVEGEPTDLGTDLAEPDTTDRDERVVLAKLAIKRLVDRVCPKGEVNRHQCFTQFCADYKAHRVGAPWIWEAVKGLSWGSLSALYKACEEGRTDDLVDRRGRNKQVRIPEGQRDFIEGHCVNTPHLAMRRLHELLSIEFGEAVVSYSTVSRYVASFRTKNAGALTRISNPDRWKNRYMVALGSASEGISRPNQRWELDSTPADLLMADGRYTLVGWWMWRRGEECFTSARHRRRRRSQH